MDFTRIDIKPHQITPLLATPRTIALISAGAAFYLGYVDPNVRDSLVSIRQRLRHWVHMFKGSRTFMGSLSIIGSLVGIGCYLRTKINLWLVGSAVMSLIWPYSIIVNQSTNRYLLDIDSKLAPNLQMTSGQRFTVLDKIKHWVKGYRGTLYIALLAAGIFYLSQLKSTQTVDVGVIVK